MCPTMFRSGQARTMNEPPSHFIMHSAVLCSPQSCVPPVHTAKPRDVLERLTAPGGPPGPPPPRTLRGKK